MLCVCAVLKDAMEIVIFKVYLNITVENQNDKKGLDDFFDIRLFRLDRLGILSLCIYLTHNEIRRQ